ncbi:MAG: TIGR00730 family Rossman fold protein [Acidimicrobiales bacterium]
MADDLVQQLLEESGATANRDVLRDILRTAQGLAGDGADRLDLKITAGALKEMRAAFAMFAPLKNTPKVTIFGSARTASHDPLYTQARELARDLAEAGWFVITGAGPGIMQAGAEGAGPDHAIGISIQLPFEEKPSDILAGGDRVVAMKYFFTRKLMLIKESSAFVCLPGGFGTQDETFELLTLLQTGKATPAPVVLLDIPGGTYWTSWVRYIDDELVSAGLVSAQDHDLFLVTDDAAMAVAAVQRFWHSYHSIRWVGERLVIRVRVAPSPDELVDLNERFADLLIDGTIEVSEPLPAEVSDRDHLDLARLVMRYDARKAARLRGLIDALNDLPSADR